MQRILIILIEKDVPQEIKLCHKNHKEQAQSTCQRQRLKGDSCDCKVLDFNKKMI